MKWTLVTGGAHRLGAEICRALARNGKNVVIHYRTSEKEAIRLAEELKSHSVEAEAIYGDFSTIETTQQFLEQYRSRYAHTEGLVNNVGNYWIASAVSISPNELHDLFQVNTLTPLMIIQGLLASLKQNRGRIVNIGMAGIQDARANTHATGYHLTKLSLSMLTKSLAKELAPHGLSVNMVSPGYLEESLELPAHMDQIPAGRVGKFQEVAEAVLFFFAKETGYITGQNIDVAGGIRL